MNKNIHKRVPLRSSALFKLTSPRRLAEILLIHCQLLEKLVHFSDSNYIIRLDNKSGRTIEESKPTLKSIQKRFVKLLQQIETPPYLHSGTKSRSYITNAAPHIPSNASIKIDIKKFFPSSSSHHVQSFFEDVLEYPPDVASRAKKLLTCNGHLPTGGNASTILSFWAYEPMFDEIENLATKHHCIFTLYVDDMSITGVFANRKCQHQIRKIINHYGLRAHKAKMFSPGQPRVITGVAQTRRGQKLPNRRAEAISKLESQEKSTSNIEEKLNYLSSLIGKLSEATIIDASWKNKKDAAVLRRRALIAAVAGQRK